MRISDFNAGGTQTQTTGAVMIHSPKIWSSLRFAITTSGWGAEQTLSGAPLPVGERTHVPVTLVGNTGTLYVNEAPVDTKAITLKPSNIAPFANYLGKSQFAADSYFNGAIDDFRIYNHGLTPAEIATMAVPPTATIVPRPSYAWWASGFSFPDGQGLPGADPDGEGHANLLEWLFGTAPINFLSNTMLNANRFTAAQLGFADGKNYLGLTARLRKIRPGTTLIPQGATSPNDLGTAESATQVILSALPRSMTATSRFLLGITARQ